MNNPTFPPSTPPSPFYYFRGCRGKHKDGTGLQDMCNPLGIPERTPTCTHNQRPLKPGTTQISEWLQPHVSSLSSDDHYVLRYQRVDTQPQSAKYPGLNPVLADDTTLLRYDTKVKPPSTIQGPIYLTHRHEPALRKETKHMRIISKSFPWQIDIITPINVTVEDVWMSVYTALQQPIVDSEWGFIIKEKDARATVEKFMKKRLDADKTAEKVARRIDYLGDCTLFRGLEKDDEFAQARLVPFSKKCDETWVIKLMS